MTHLKRGVLGGVILGCCGVVWGQEADIPARLGHPDLIVYNAKIVTMDDESFSDNPGTIVQAMAVRDDKLLALGRNNKMRALAGPETRQINLQGRTVMPGFILTHEHPTDWAWTEPTALNHVFPEGNEHMVVRFLEGDAEEQMARWDETLKEAVATADPGQWILLSSDFGANFEHMPRLFTDFFSHITHQLLDEIAPDNPVRVKNNWPAGMLNSQALKVVKRVFPEQAKEELGTPRQRSELLGLTGRQLEPDVILHGKVKLNAELLKSEMELWAAHGVTVYASSPYTIGNLQALSQLDDEGRMPGRFAWSYNGPDLHYQTLRLVSALLNNGSDYLWNIGAQGRVGGSCTTLPASDRVKQQEDCAFEPGDIGRRILEDIVRSGGRVAAMHSGGDKDIDYMLDVIEEQSRVAGLSLQEIREKRHAFDHGSGAPRPDQIPRIKRLGMMVSMINTVLWENRTGYDTAYRVRNYGEEYAHYAVPRKSVTEAGIMATQEIDRMLPHYLFYNLWVGMTRYNEGCKRTFAPEERTDLMVQLKGLTSWGAYYVLRGDKLGSLEPGKLADFVVLDRDILNIPHNELPQTKVLMTVIGGRTVHVLPELADQVNMTPVGPTTWKSRPLQTRFIFRGPPDSCPAL